jgi:hypothetical protein
MQILSLYDRKPGRKSVGDEATRFRSRRQASQPRQSEIEIERSMRSRYSWLRGLSAAFPDAPLCFPAEEQLTEVAAHRMQSLRRIGKMHDREAIILFGHSILDLLDQIDKIIIGYIVQRTGIDRDPQQFLTVISGILLDMNIVQRATEDRPLRNIGDDLLDFCESGLHRQMSFKAEANNIAL